jgi:hypothetical protein
MKLGLVVGSWRIGSGVAGFELHLLAGESEETGAIAGAVVGEQGAAQDAADRGWTGTDAARNFVAGHVRPAQLDDGADASCDRAGQWRSTLLNNERSSPLKQIARHCACGVDGLRGYPR